MEIPFLGPAYQSRSENYSTQRLVNMYLEKGQGKKPWVLIGTPGLTHFNTYSDSSGGGAIRGISKLNDSLVVVVCGSRIFTTDFNAVLNGHDSISDDGQPVSIATNGTDVLVVSSGNLYALSQSTGLITLIRNNVGSVDFIDGYFVIAEEGTGKFYISGLYTTDIDALDFATAEGAPDNLVKVIVSNKEVVLFGTETTEFWYNSGNADFPFSRVQGAFIEEGLAAKHSAVKCGNTVAWLGKSKDGDSTVWMFEGYRPVPISNNAISYAIGQWERKDDAWAFFYKQEEHAFYVLTSPSASETWVYDFSTGQWHQRAWLDEYGIQRRIRVNTHINFGGRAIVGDWETGKVYYYDLDTYTDDGDPILRIRSCQTIQNDLKENRNRRFRLDMDTGVGLSTGQGSDPQAMLRYSRDGGKTWSNELWRPIGAIGKYGTQVAWNRVGGGERMAYEVSISDPVKVCITGAYLE